MQMVFLVEIQGHWTIFVHQLASTPADSAEAFTSLDHALDYDISDQIALMQFFRNDRPGLQVMTMSYIPVLSKTDARAPLFPGSRISLHDVSDHHHSHPASGVFIGILGRVLLLGVPTRDPDRQPQTSLNRFARREEKTPGSLHRLRCEC